MLARVSSRELTEWAEYYKREPFGEEWKQTAYICTQISNGTLKKEGGGSFKTEDFYPIAIVRETPRQSDDYVEAMFNRAAVGAKPITTGKPKPVAVTKKKK